MYNTKILKCDVACSWPLPCRKLSHLGPPQAWRTLWTAPCKTAWYSSGDAITDSYYIINYPLIQNFEAFFSYDISNKQLLIDVVVVKVLSWDWWHFSGIRKIDPDFYVEQKDDYFGSQPIQSLQLCAMKKAEGGYYPVDHEVFFGKTSDRS